MNEKLKPFEQAKEHLKGYRTVASVKCQAHTQAAVDYEHRNLWLGVPVVVLSAAVGSSVFASLSAEKLPVWATVLVGFLAVAATVLSSLQTFLGYSDRSQRHQKAAASYHAARRAMDVWLFELSQASANLQKSIEIMRQAGALMNDADALAPNLPDGQISRATEALRVDLERYKQLATDLEKEKYDIATG